MNKLVLYTIGSFTETRGSLGNHSHSYQQARNGMLVQFFEVAEDERLRPIEGFRSIAACLVFFSTCIQFLTMGHISGLTEQPERLVVQTLPDTAYFAVSLCGGVAEFSLSKNCLRCRNGAEPRALVQKPSMRGRLGGKSTAGEHPEEAALFQCTEGPVGLDRWAHESIGLSRIITR